MKARIFKIFRDYKHHVRYTYVDTPKRRDDVEAVSHYDINVPMMTVRIYGEDGKLGEEVNLFASPEIVMAYTQIDFFNLIKGMFRTETYNFSIQTSNMSYSWEIEFEITKGDYPYLNQLVEVGKGDYLIPHTVEYPKIIRLYKEKHHW